MGPHQARHADPAKSPDYAKAMGQTHGETADSKTWRERQKSGLVGGLNGAYFDIAKELRARVAPVGIARFVAAIPSADSDYDLWGVHLLPLAEVVGMKVGHETVEKSGVYDGLETNA